MLMPYDYHSFVRELGRRVRKLRKERGWTIRDMIVHHGYHDTQWRGIERGEGGISVRSLLKLADLFDMPLSELIADLGEEDAHRQSREKPSEARRGARGA